MSDELHKIAIFQKREIRKQLHNGEWWFVINDIIVALADSTNPVDYLKKMRARDSELAELFKIGSVDKGGDKLYPPLPCRSTLLVESKTYSAGIPKESSNPALVEIME